MQHMEGVKKEVQIYTGNSINCNSVAKFTACLLLEINFSNAMSSPRQAQMLFPGLMGRSKSRKKQLSAIFQLKEEKKKKKKITRSFNTSSIHEVIPVEQLKRLLLDVPSKNTQNQFLEKKVIPNFLTEETCHSLIPYRLAKWNLFCWGEK